MSIFSRNAVRATKQRLPIAVCYLTHKADTLKPFEEVPGPGPLPLVGNFWRYLPYLGEYSINGLHKNGLYNLKRYGPLVREVVGKYTILHVFDPKDMETVFRNEGQYPQRRSHRALLKYRLDRPDKYASGGLFPENGEEWHRCRKMFQSALLSETNVNRYVEPCEAITEQLIEVIRSKRDSNFEIMDLQDLLFRWALENTCMLAFDTSVGALDLNASEKAVSSLLIKAAHDTHDAIAKTEMSAMDIWKICQTPSYRKMVAAQDFMADFAWKQINAKLNSLQTRKAEGRPSMLEQLLQNERASRKHVFCFLLDILLAGIDTTAFVAAFTLYHLANNSTAQARVREDVVKTQTQKWSKICAKDLKELKFLKACVKETMRLNPVSIGVGRVMPRDVAIRGYRVPAGTMVITGNQVACRQAENFPSPNSFMPERWLQPGANKAPFAYLPFGYGPRMCTGKRFSEMEVCLLVSKIVRNFDLQYVHEEIGTVTRLINVADKPMRIRLTDVQY